ncbi:phosphotransferase family protein [Amycolatopsis sp.]|uniref:phosphotransferase family protein n=1 Tax=Amycolatopsis sp. TaxID=37632 RepID=UPI002C59FA72|nr:phosphotransferase family protein [Amycolatopsis sp.]HVV11881.1 phosphotransferase family protein [Amycolatopsis sp.]
MTTAPAPRALVTDGLRAQVESYLGTCLGRPVRVGGLSKLAGGASHETWGVDVHDHEGDGTRRFVLRRELEHGPLDGDLQQEFDLLVALHERGLPVPRPHWCEVRDSPLGLPFMVIDRVPGVDVRKALADPERTPDREELGLRLVRLQARIHATPVPEGWGAVSAPSQEVERWADAIDAATKEPGPLVAGALEWLRTHAPAPGPVGLVHGDFKANNLLFGSDGVVTVLDWELAHLGDPVEDLAWTMLWTTGFDLVGGLLSEPAYLRAYEAVSGRAVEPSRLAFWRLLALVKLAAIFLTGAVAPDDGRAVRPTLQLLGRAMVHVDHRLAGALRAVAGEDVP